MQGFIHLLRPTFFNTPFILTRCHINKKSFKIVLSKTDSFSRYNRRCYKQNRLQNKAINYIFTQPPRRCVPFVHVGWLSFVRPRLQADHRDSDDGQERESQKRRTEHANDFRLTHCEHAETRIVLFCSVRCSRVITRRLSQSETVDVKGERNNGRQRKRPNEQRPHGGPFAHLHHRWPTKWHG